MPLYCNRDGRDGHSWFRAKGRSKLPTTFIDNVLLSFYLALMDSIILVEIIHSFYFMKIDKTDALLSAPKTYMV